MGYLYILHNIKGKYYIGSTNDLIRRLAEHNAGYTKSTKYNGPWKIAFSQKYDTLLEARKAEYKLKQFKRKDIIARIVGEQKIELGI